MLIRRQFVAVLAVAVATLAQLASPVSAVGDAPAASVVSQDRFTFQGSRTWNVSSLSSPIIGDEGPLFRFNVKTEADVVYDADQFAAEVVEILSDERSWAGIQNVRFQLVPGGRESGLASDADVEFTLYLATPNTVDALCAPLPTRGRLSCRNGHRVVENFHRWMRGPDVYHNLFADELETYRRYLINHEVGHRIGKGHENISTCRSDRYAPVMMQQTFGLRGCAINGWPAWDRLTVGTGPEPAPPPEPPTGACEPSVVFPWEAGDRPLDDAVLRLYEAGLARAPDPGGFRHWQSVAAAGRSFEQIAGDFLASPEGTGRYGGSNDSAFVRSVYRNVLRREPDAPGHAFWLGQLDAGVLSRASLLRQLADSSENIDRTNTVVPQPSRSGWLARLYGVVFNRTPDCTGARFWLWSLDQMSEAEVVDQLLASPEFFDRYGDLNDRDFVEALYEAVLGRPAEAEGLAFWHGELASDRLDRAGLIGRWLASPELIVRTGTTP